MIKERTALSLCSDSLVFRCEDSDGVHSDEVRRDDNDDVYSDDVVKMCRTNNIRVRVGLVCT